MTYRDWLREAERLLAENGIGDAGADAFILLSGACGIDRLWYTLHGGEPLPEEQRMRLEGLLKKRAGRIPVQQLVGEAWFMGYPFFVNEHVLIPRQDTEILVEQVMREVQERHGRGEEPLTVLDVCTGSGCILLSLMRECPYIEGTGADISEEALAVAGENAKRLGVRAELIKSDLFERVKGRYTVIVSNPPYIAAGVIDTLMPEVREHEPRLALDGGEDGLDFYRRIAAESGLYLEKGGCLALEIGYDQGEAVRGLLGKAGFSDIRIIKDLAGLDRVVTGYMQNGG